MGFLLLPELSLLNRFAFAATRFRYRWTIFSPEAPAIRLAVASTSSIYLFTDHSFSFGPGAVATLHQFHHPQPHNAICLGCQHHQRGEHPRVGLAWFETGNPVHLTATFCSARNWVNICDEAGRPAPQRANRSRHRKRRAVLLVHGNGERAAMLELRAEHRCGQFSPNKSRSGQDQRLTADRPPQRTSAPAPATRLSISPRSATKSTGFVSLPRHRLQELFAWYQVAIGRDHDDGDVRSRGLGLRPGCLCRLIRTVCAYAGWGHPGNRPARSVR